MVRVMITVLLIEKDYEFRRGIARQLISSYGFKVVEAGSSDELEELLATLSANVAVVGLTVGGKYEGLKVIENIKSLKPWLPVIVMVPEKITSLSIEAMRHGACDDIFVPFDVEELVAKIQQVVGKKKKAKKPRWKEKWEKIMVSMTFAEAGYTDYAKKILDEMDEKKSSDRED
jgi:DNA-binding NtrC family response regulator